MCVHYSHSPPTQQSDSTDGTEWKGGFTEVNERRGRLCIDSKHADRPETNAASLYISSLIWYSACLMSRSFSFLAIKSRCQITQHSQLREKGFYPDSALICLASLFCTILAAELIQTELLESEGRMEEGAKRVEQNSHCHFRLIKSQLWVQLDDNMNKENAPLCPFGRPNYCVWKLDGFTWDSPLFLITYRVAHERTVKKLCGFFGNPQAAMFAVDLWNNVQISFWKRNPVCWLQRDLPQFLSKWSCVSRCASLCKDVSAYLTV